MSTGDHCCIYVLHARVSLIKKQSVVVAAVSAVDLLIRQQQMPWIWQACTHLMMFSSPFQLIAIIQLPLYKHSAILNMLRMPLTLQQLNCMKSGGKALQLHWFLIKM